MSGVHETDKHMLECARAVAGIISTAARCVCIFGYVARIGLKLRCAHVARGAPLYHNQQLQCQLLVGFEQLLGDCLQQQVAASKIVEEEVYRQGLQMVTIIKGASRSRLNLSGEPPQIRSHSDLLPKLGLSLLRL